MHKKPSCVNYRFGIKLNTMRKTFLIAAVAILLFLGLLFLQSQNNSKRAGVFTEPEKQQALEQILGRKAKNDQDVKPLGNKTYQGKYFTLQYPASAKIYDLKELNASASSNLELFSFDLFDPRMTFTAQANRSQGLTTQSLTDIPAVKLRKLKKELYSEEDREINLKPIVVFTKKQEGGEKSGFLIRPGIFYSFSLSSPSYSEDLEKIFDQIISTIKINK